MIRVRAVIGFQHDGEFLLPGDVVRVEVHTASDWLKWGRVELAEEVEPGERRNGSTWADSPDRAGRRAGFTR